MDEFENDLVGDELLSSIDLDRSPPTDPLPNIPPFIAPTRIDFPGFPFDTPYPQQVDLMRALYDTLAAGKCGVFESPTGTGKSLTLLTACLHWLLDHQRATDEHIQHLRNCLTAESSDALGGGGVEGAGKSTSNWVVEYSRQRSRRLQVIREMTPYEACSRASTKATNLVKTATEERHRLASSTRAFTKLSHEYSSLFPDHVKSLDDFDECDMDTDESRFLTAETESLLHRSSADLHPLDTYHEGDTDDCRVVQIIYCSRTHSQLAQINEELKKMKDLCTNLTTLTLASRQFLCVNESVFSLKNQSLVRDACLDLAGKSPGCKYRASSAVEELSNHLLGTRLPATETACAIRGGAGGDKRASVSQIEELPVHACPYYANRRGIPLAQVVLAPYQTVVVPSSRQAAGLTLHGNVVVFDEAHNLLEAVAAAFSSTISHSELLSAQRLLESYSRHYRPRLSALSILRLRQLLQVTRSCVRLLDDGGGLDAQRRKHLQNVENRRPGCEGNGVAGGREEDGQEAVYSLSDWLFISGLDHINFSYLVDYLKADRCAQKIAGFGKWICGRRRRQNKSEAEEAPSAGDLRCSRPSLSLSDCFEKLKRPPKPQEVAPRSKRPRLDKNNQPKAAQQAGPQPSRDDLETAGRGLFALLAFLEALVGTDCGDDDARLIVKPSSSSPNAKQKRETGTGPAEEKEEAEFSRPDGQIRFIILNPGRYLYDAVREARSLILVGGTMKPFDEFMEQIFRPAGKLSSEISVFSCGHVIDACQQLRIYTPPTSPKGVSWDFTFKNRNNIILMNECGEFLIDVCKMVPGGVVVFFPSFDYMATVWAHWQSNGLMTRLQEVKLVFKEPRKSTALSQVIQAYARAIDETGKKRRKSGACIACVMGGKLSEGINFNDDLARGVVIVGLPYPNIRSAVMREKIAFLDRRFSGVKRSQIDPAGGGGGAGHRACEAACMRLVNQAIGRAIRHASDFAVVFLLDARYTRRRQVRDQLPAWTRDSIAPPPHSTAFLVSDLAAFFAQNYQRLRKHTV